MKQQKSTMSQFNPVLIVKVADGDELVVKKRIVLIVLHERHTFIHVWDKKQQKVVVIRSFTRTLNAYDALLKEQFFQIDRQTLVNLLRVKKVTNERKVVFKEPVEGNYYMNSRSYTKFLARA